MTDLRFLQLKALVDECSCKVNCLASLEHSVNEDNIFISMFWTDEYHGFTTNKNHENRYNSTQDDDDMTKAETFIRMLMRSADFYEGMRRS